jgi:hypothetical protein
MRPTKTMTEPKRPKTRCTRSTSYQSSVSQRPCRLMNHLNRRSPIERASRYQRRLPAIAPAVPAAITPPRLIGPLAARIPATVMITSDGIGGKTVSRNIRAETPQ